MSLAFLDVLFCLLKKINFLVTLSTTEAENVSLILSLCDTIPIVDILDEVHKHDLFNSMYKTQVKCTAFEISSRALELSMVSKIRPRTKHINTKYNHFRSHVPFLFNHSLSSSSYETVTFILLLIIII